MSHKTMTLQQEQMFEEATKAFQVIDSLPVEQKDTIYAGLRSAMTVLGLDVEQLGEQVIAHDAEGKPVTLPGVKRGW
ncbi:MAG: hypothetical protein C0473_01220 [Cyanobacteria bacterium DS3.002]|nr:hypothetical protein [Cyanobacteria bacterium DS3.002]